MSCQVELPPRLAEVVGLNDRKLSASGSTLKEICEALCDVTPLLRPHLLNASGRLKDHIHVFLNGQSVASDFPVQEDDHIVLLIAQSGGSGCPSLADEEVERYARQITLPDVGRVGQALLKRASVLVVGAGGLGAAVLPYIAAAGRIGIVDPDVVEVTNLQRQVIHDTASIGQPKVHSAAARLRAINPLV